MSWSNPTPTSDIPNWLSNDEENAAASKDWDTTVDPTVASQPSTELSPSSTSLSGDATGSSKKPRERAPLCTTLTMLTISGVFLGAFVYAAMTQNKVSDEIEWYIYFAISASIVAFFMCHYLCCFPTKIIYGLASGMIVWSIYKLVVIGLKVGDEPKGSDQREDYIWELAKCSVGMFSALYHMSATRCTAKPEKTEE